MNVTGRGGIRSAGWDAAPGGGGKKTQREVGNKNRISASDKDSIRSSKEGADFEVG